MSKTPKRDAGVTGIKPTRLGGFANLAETQRTAYNSIMAAFKDLQDIGKPGFVPQIQALTTEYETNSDTLSNFIGYIQDTGLLSGTDNNNSATLTDSEVQIGTVRLTVPPERISVQEMPNLIEVPGLRTDGTTVIKTGKGRINIVLDLVFGSDRAINKELRPLIAQFRGYPYVPVVSQYIAQIVQPKVQKITNDGAKERLDTESAQNIFQIAKKKQRITDRINQLFQLNPELRAAAETTDDFANAQTEFNGVNSSIAEVETAFARMMQALRTATGKMIQAKTTNQVKATQDIQKAEAELVSARNQLKSALLKQQRIQHAIAALQIGGTVNTELGIVPCCLDQLQVYTVEDRPRMLRARLVLSYFNSGPFGGVLQYRDILGRPTIDPKKALYFNRYLDATWLKQPTLINPPGDARFTSDPTDTLKFNRTAQIIGLPEFNKNSNVLTDALKIGYADVRLETSTADEQRPNIETALNETNQDNKKLEESRADYTTLVIGEKSNGFDGTIRGMTATLANRLSFQSVQGEFYPTVQYMGGKPAFAEVEVLCTNDDIIQQIHNMKMASQRMSTLATREARRPEVHIRNTLLNLLGIYTAQVENISTQTISPNTTKIAIRFVEHRIDLQERESLTRSTLFSRNRIRDVLKFLVRLASNHVDGRNREQIAITKEGELKHQRQAHELLYVKFSQYLETQDALQQATADQIRQNIDKSFRLVEFAKNPLSYTMSEMFEEGPYDALVNTLGLANQNWDPVPIDQDVFQEVIFKPSIVAKALFLEENPKGPKDLQLATRKQVLINAGLARQTAADVKLGNELTDATTARIIDSHGGPEGTAMEIIRRWGWGNAQHRSIKETERAQREAGKTNPNPLPLLVTSPPGDLELTLIADYLVRSSGNAADEVKLVEGKDGARVVRKDGQDKTDDIRTVELLIYNIINNTVEEPGQEFDGNIIGGNSIRKIGMGDAQVRDFVRNNRDIPSLLYPDLHLPTYRTMLEPLLRAIKESSQAAQESGKPTLIQPTYKWTSIQDPDNRDALSPTVKNLLNVFIPTYRQIGQIPDQLGLSLDDFAYDLDDSVLPDFPFFGTRIDNIVAKAFETSTERSYSMPAGFVAKRNSQGMLIDENGNVKKTTDPLAQARHHKLFEQGNAATRPQDGKRNKQKSVQPIGSRINTEVLTTELYSPGFDRTRLQNLGINSAEVHKDIFEASANSFDDNIFSMRRCFPTFRLFFIEEDTKEGVWTAIDDVYGYNSVISLNVTRHKNQPDLAEVKVTNLQGNLEADKFGISTAQRGGGDPRYVTNKGRKAGRTQNSPNGVTDIHGPEEPGTRERGLRRFPLSEGTRIKIQMGYHSNPRYLDTVFTGKIAQVTMGDIVHFIAQGYLQELLFPMINNPNTERTRGVIETVLNSPTVQHFGTWTPYSWRYMTPQERKNSQTHSMLSSFGESFERFYADPKLRNVWVAQYGTWWGEQLERLFYQDKWEVGGGTKTGWDVIQEIVGYTPGYIAAVVPYDSEATLFVGRPEQAYFYTDSNQDLHNNWAATESRRRIRGQRLTQDISRLYFESENYDGDKNNLPSAGVTLDRAGGALTSNVDTKTKQWLNLARTYPKWTAALEGINTAVDSRSLQTADEDRGRNFYQPMFLFHTPAVTDKLVPDLRGDKTILEYLEQLDRTTSPKNDFFYIHSVLGRNDEARRLIMTILADIMGRNARYLTVDLGTVNTAQLVGEAITDNTLSKFEEINNDANALRSVMRRVVDPLILFEEIWDGNVDRDHMRDKIGRAVEGVRFEDPVQSDPVFDKEMMKTLLRRWLFRYTATIPVALTSLKRFVQENLLALNLNVDVDDVGGRSKVWTMSPRMRPFRNYHVVTSMDDILENQMSATRGAMWNTVAISGASGPPLQIKADDGIINSDIQIRYFREPNADNDFSNVTSQISRGGFVNNRFLIGYTRLAQGMRNMYRGQLVLRGRPNIKPWDIVYVYDTYNMIFGPIEVERVTHHFSTETGFVTTIVPHLVTIPNNQIDCASMLAQGWFLGGIGLGIVGAVAALGGLALGAVAGIPVGLAVALGLALGGKSVSDFIFNEIAGTTLNGLLIGNGQFGGLNSPVKIFPLMRRGAPWVASIRGWGEQNEWTLSGFVWENVSKLGRKVEDAEFFRKRLWDKWAAVVNPQDLETRFVNDARTR